MEEGLNISPEQASNEYWEKLNMGMGTDTYQTDWNKKGEEDNSWVKEVLKRMGIENPASNKQGNYNSTSFQNRDDFVRTMGESVYQSLEKQGLDADMWTPIVVALIAHESGWGKHTPGGNNFAGIKAAKGEASVSAGTKEWSPVKGYYSTKSNFKRYDTLLDFTDDLVYKLKNRFGAFNGTPSDYVANIKKHGYFTAPLANYLKSVNSILSYVNKVL